MKLPAFPRRSAGSRRDPDPLAAPQHAARPSPAMARGRARPPSPTVHAGPVSVSTGLFREPLDEARAIQLADWLAEGPMQDAYRDYLALLAQGGEHLSYQDQLRRRGRMLQRRAVRAGQRVLKLLGRSVEEAFEALLVCGLQVVGHPLGEVGRRERRGQVGSAAGDHAMGPFKTWLAENLAAEPESPAPASPAAGDDGVAP